MFILCSGEGCGERKKRRRGLSLHAFCGRAMKEDGDPLDTSLPLLAGLILETLGDLEEAAVRYLFSSVSAARIPSSSRYKPSLNYAVLCALIKLSPQC